MNMDMTLEQLAAELRQYSEFELSVSEKPDVDLAGSVGALAMGIQGIGKRCCICIPEKIPAKCRMLLSGYRPDEVINPVRIKLDTGLPMHSDGAAGREMKFSVKKDNHTTNTEWRIVNPQAASGCEIIFGLLKVLNVTITPDIADLLYAGIITETMRFCTSSFSAETLRLAAELIDHGAHAVELARGYTIEKEPDHPKEAPQQGKVFVNCSNHPSAQWSAEQRKAAEKDGSLVDVPFPMVPGEATVETIQTMADELAQQIIQLHPKTVMCQGEFTLTFAAVRRLQDAGIVCVSACTVRNTVETIMPDGTTSKQSIFKFAGFRPYEKM